MFRTIYTSLLIFSTITLQAQAVLLKDINPSTQNGLGDETFALTPNQVAQIGNKVFFIADDGVHGDELWVTDGSTGGTQMVKDINPGPGAGAKRNHTMRVFNGVVFFIGDDGTGDEQIYLSDGTAAVTLKVNIPLMTNPSQMVVTPQWIYFVANSLGSSSKSLWRTNGFDIGSMEVSNSSFTGGGTYAELVALGDEVYFTHDNGDGCLSKSNGLSITQVTCIKQNVLAYLENLTAVGDKLYFSGSVSYSDDYEPYISDGTAAGTLKLKDISTSAGSNPKWFTAFKNKVYFVASRKLWVTEGTEASTQKLGDITVSYAQNDQSYFFATPEFLYFPGDDSFVGTDQELWKTDGTLAGTVLVKELSQFSAGNPREFALGNGKVYFQANNGEGEELWVTNGTEAGTTKLTNLDPSPNGGGRPRKLVQIGQKLYFIANSPATGAEWFTVDLPVSLFEPGVLELSLSALPNPVTSEFTVQIDQPDSQETYQLGVYSPEGRLMFQQTVSGTQLRINCASWPQGMYRILVRDSHGRLGSMTCVKA